MGIMLSDPHLYIYAPFPSYLPPVPSMCASRKFINFTSSLWIEALQAIFSRNDPTAITAPSVIPQNSRNTRLSDDPFAIESSCSKRRKSHGLQKYSKHPVHWAEMVTQLFESERLHSNSTNAATLSDVVNLHQVHIREVVREGSGISDGAMRSL